MTLDIRGSIKNTKLSSNPYVVFEEIISNAIDSFLIRTHADSSDPNLSVKIRVDFSASDLFGDGENMSLSCKDNGCGLGDDQLNAFLTKDTSYKDDLTISGIGQCKGAGRIQFFHHFSALSIDSTYRHGSEILRCQMRYSEPQKQIDYGDFASSSGNEADIGTLIRLEHFKDAARARIAQGEPLSNLFSAPLLKKQMLVAFLQRLVGLESRLGDFEFEFLTSHWKAGDKTETLKRSDLPTVTAAPVVQVEERDPHSGDALGTFQTFKLSHYQLDASLYDLPKNAIAFCAKYSPVKNITARYLKTRTEQNNPVAGFHHIVLIESDFLDEHVNEQRDDFDNIPEDIPTGDMFSDAKLSYVSIHEAIDPIIDAMVTPADWKKEDVLNSPLTKSG